MESVNWTWGLSLIALTIAIHAMGVVAIALAGFGIRARLETRKLGLWHLIPIVIGMVGAVGLLLAVLHVKNMVIFVLRGQPHLRRIQLQLVVLKYAHDYPAMALNGDAVFLAINAFQLEVFGCRAEQ